MAARQLEIHDKKFSPATVAYVRKYIEARMAGLSQNDARQEADSEAARVRLVVTSDQGDVA